MGEHELREALHGKALAQIHALWEQAEAEVAARRQDVAQQLADLRAEMNGRVAKTVANERRTALAAAELAARRQRLAAEAEFGKRLYLKATELLPSLLGTARSRLWLALAKELPAARWRQVLVHPDDLEPARQRFPEAVVETDPALIGGVVADADDGRVVVDNSLAGRLARAWPEMLTPLIDAVREEVDRNVAGPAPAD